MDRRPPRGSSVSVEPPSLLRRQRDVERRALADLALGPDAPAVLLDDSPADEEPKAHAVELAVVDVRRAREPFEDVREVRRRDADARISYRDARLAVLLPDPDGDRRVVRAVLARVLDEVLHHLLDASSVVDPDDGPRRVQLGRVIG